MKESKKGAESVEDQRVIEELKKLDTITKTQQQTNDDIVLNHLRSMDLRFQNTEVRKRQHTCLAKDVPVDQLPNFSQSVTLGSLRLGLKAILEMDKEDKSLERYKKSLLGEFPSLLSLSPKQHQRSSLSRLRSSHLEDQAAILFLTSK
eukprot:TRINITY_DN8798_c0_g1_i1.p1 TRINITY_DN8798_c0_g1~~TRINITY_DN8798_c0_g1_i1.p1  ORF type:complete len:148 (-),score=41.11 TRINITY_DN8798_c0_g1_i1:42-485(-)